MWSTISKVDLKKNALCGAEALVRWVRDDKLILPSQFVSVLEENGQIEILDMYVLDHVCRDIRSWLDAGIIPERISTNFSKLHFKNPQFVDNILRIIKKYDIRLKAAFLKEAGCSIAQGFLYDRPMPKSEYETRLKNKNYEL